MVPELEKPRVIEIQVRMDCNGCVQKIKKALHGINGIYDLYIDFQQQKLTIIGWADPERILKAIRKTRKVATILCSNTEPPDPNNPPPPDQQPPPEQGDASSTQPPPPPEGTQNPPPPDQPPQTEPPPPQQPQAAEPPNASPAQTDQNPPPGAAGEEHKASPPSTQAPKDVGEVHVIYHHPPDPRYSYRYGYGPAYPAHWNRTSYPNHHVYQEMPPQPRPQPPPPPPTPPQPQPVPRPQVQPEPQPYFVTHSYNTYRPSPHVTEYQYIRSSTPPPPSRHYYHTPYSMNMDHYYNEDYHETSRFNGGGNITSIFSDENPNACGIM